MLKLLKVELKTLLKFKPAKWMLVLSPLFAALVAALYALEEQPLAFTALFNGMFLVNLVTVSIGSLFLYTDYSQNTIRNKIIIGYPRFSVYMAKFVATLIFYLVCVLLFAIPSVAIDICMIGTKDVIWEAVSKNVLVILCNVIINSTIMVSITTAMKGIVGAIMPFVIVEGGCVGGMLWLEILSVDAPELYEFAQAIPALRGMMLSPSVAPADLDISIYFTIIAVILFFLIGYLSFRRTDLN